MVSAHCFLVMSVRNVPVPRLPPGRYYRGDLGSVCNFLCLLAPAFWLQPMKMEHRLMTFWRRLKALERWAISYIRLESYPT